MKAATEQGRITIRNVLAYGGLEWNECPCGWFYSGARCSDKQCKEWKKAVKVYIQGKAEDRELSLDEKALCRLAYWGNELVFENDIVHIFPVKS